VRLHRFSKGPGFGYANRNAVLRATTAAYVAYLTDDDLWFPDHLERGLARLQAGPLDLIAFRSAHIQPPDVVDPWFFAFDWMGPGAAFLRHWFTGPVSIVHRRSLFDQLGYWNQAVNRFGDREFYNRVRRSTLRSCSDEEITSLRFFARHWDRHYASLREPPQKRYLERVADLAWRRELMALAQGRARPWSVRRRQFRDFFAFGLGSGPRFVRFWIDYVRGPKQAMGSRPAP
jgi:hypothetical protein